MDKIYHCAKRAEDAILKSVHELDAEKTLDPLVVQPLQVVMMK